MFITTHDVLTDDDMALEARRIARERGIDDVEAAQWMADMFNAMMEAEGA